MLSSHPIGAIHIVTSEGRQTLREDLFSPSRIAEELRNHTRVAVALPPGGGKSNLLDRLVTDPDFQARYDLHIVLSATYAIQEERMEVRALRQGFHQRDIRTFDRRPRDLCGSLELEWILLELVRAHDWARHSLCQARCPHHGACQYVLQSLPEYTAGVKAVYAVVDHLRQPGFLTRLIQSSGAQSPILIIDESRVLELPQRETILNQQLRQLDQILQDPESRLRHSPRLIHIAQVLKGLQATGPNHTANGELTGLLPYERARIQKIGVELFGNRYDDCVLAFERFARATERWQVPGIGYDYIYTPELPCPTLLLAAHVDEAWINHRLPGEPWKVIGSEVKLLDQGTLLFNLQSSLGASCHFLKNMPQILDVFAQLTAHAIRRGERVLLIAKKALIAKIHPVMTEYLQQREGLTDVRVITDNFSAENLLLSRNVCLINYGSKGINAFEHVENCFCLTSYYVNDAVISDLINENLPPSKQVEVEILPDREIRTLHGILPAAIAEGALKLAENGVVDQAISRCRHTIHPRCVITFQRKQLDYPYAQTFYSLDEMRRHFNLLPWRQRERRSKWRQARDLRAAGKTVQQVAQELNISERYAYELLSKAADPEPKPK